MLYIYSTIMDGSIFLYFGLLIGHLEFNRLELNPHRNGSSLVIFLNYRMGEN